MYRINVKLKETCRHLLKSVLWYFPLRDYIVFESNPAFSCNTYPVFQQLRKDFPDYKLIWSIDRNTRQIPSGVDDIIYEKPDSIYERFKTFYFLNRCRLLVSCNRVLEKQNDRQISIFLCHGSKTKKTRGVYEVGGKVDFVNVQSHFFDDVILYEYNCRKDQLVYLGYPRCDFFYKKSDKNTAKLLFHCETARFCIWLPTLRRQISGRDDVGESGYHCIGMPLIYSKKALFLFNRFLEESQVHILFKPHPTQDVKSLTKESLSNIHIITDRDLQDKGLQLYEVIAQSDALITDYSSVFFDYLLLDRPIATTTDDIENWKSRRGFAFDLEALYEKATVRIPDLETLEKFILQVLSGKDMKGAGRREVKSLTNRYCDGNSAKRVSDFLKEKLDLTIKKRI